MFKVYVERAWPECDVIVGNPPFLGDKFFAVNWATITLSKPLRKLSRQPRSRLSDLCCYWFEKARDLIEHGKCKRAGLLATQAIRGGANREVLKRIKDSGDIFFAEGDRDWVLDGATVHVSMVGFDGGTERAKFLNGVSVPSIEVNLSTHGDFLGARLLAPNSAAAFMAQ